MVIHVMCTRFSIKLIKDIIKQCDSNFIIIFTILDDSYIGFSIRLCNNYFLLNNESNNETHFESHSIDETIYNLKNQFKFKKYVF